MILSLAFFLAAAVFVASSSPVFAQTPCIAQASYPAVSSPQYYNSNIAVTVPVSASCTYIVGPLFAVGNAYDATTNTSVGSVSTGLGSVGGSYTGQLLFSLPPSTLGHTVQFSVSIYSNNYGQIGSLLGSTSQSITIGPYYYQSYPYYSNCYNGYYYSGTSCYYPGYNGYYYYPGYYSITIYGNGYYRWHRHS